MPISTTGQTKLAALSLLFVGYYAFSAVAGPRVWSGRSTEQLNFLPELHFQRVQGIDKCSANQHRRLRDAIFVGKGRVVPFAVQHFRLQTGLA
jgi:hypothetical protein